MPEHPHCLAADIHLEKKRFALAGLHAPLVAADYEFGRAIAAGNGRLHLVADELKGIVEPRIACREIRDLDQIRIRLEEDANVSGSDQVLGVDYACHLLSVDVDRKHVPNNHEPEQIAAVQGDEAIEQHRHRIIGVVRRHDGGARVPPQPEMHADLSRHRGVCLGPEQGEARCRGTADAERRRGLLPAVRVALEDQQVEIHERRGIVVKSFFEP